MPFHRVAILGGSGFIGRYIVKRLAERDAVLTVGGRNAAYAAVKSGAVPSIRFGKAIRILKAPADRMADGKAE